MLKLKYHISFFDSIINLNQDERNAFNHNVDVSMIYEDFFNLMIIDVTKLCQSPSKNDKFTLGALYRHIINNYDELYQLATHTLPKKSKEEFIILSSEISDFFKTDEVKTIIKLRHNGCAHLTLNLTPNDKTNILIIKSITEKILCYLNEIEFFVEGSTTHYATNQCHIISTFLRLKKVNKMVIEYKSAFLTESERIFFYNKFIPRYFKRNKLNKFKLKQYDDFLKQLV